MNVIEKLKNRVVFNARIFGHMRFEEPIVVFESDDWGKVNSNSSSHFKGQRTDWSFDRLENEQELDELFSLLRGFENDFERHPVFTANFLISNPNVEKTIQANFKSLALEPIDKSFPNLLKEWKKGIQQEVFYPQYHGRLHYNLELYQQSLINDNDAQTLFKNGINGGIEHYVSSSTAYHSEYQNLANGQRPKDISTWIKTGLEEFERIFGFASISTIAPNYVISPEDFQVLNDNGIKFLQGSNKIYHWAKGGEVYDSHCQGKLLIKGLTALCRNHKFEPCRGRDDWKADFSIGAAKYWIRNKVPVVFDTHRINYVSHFAENSRNELKKLIYSFRDISNLKFLTSVELGEAMINNGSYTDVFTGKKKYITPLDNTARKITRSWVS